MDAERSPARYAWWWFLALALLAALNALAWALLDLGTGRVVRIVLVLVFIACTVGFARLSVSARRDSRPPS